MDGGPYRAPQPADRRVANRAEPKRQPEQSQPVREEPKAYQADVPSSRAAKETPRKRRILIPILAIIAILLIVGVGLFAWSRSQNSGTAIDSNKYQAVFFTNGQVYFGKLQAFNNDYLKMTDIYYLQTQSTDSTDKKLQQASSDQNNVQLIKLGSEIHGPEDQMVISKDQVLFYENLKADGKVAQSIANYKTTKN